MVCLALSVASSIYAQQKDITIFEKKEGDQNIVIARNTGKVAYLVTLNITSTGMQVTPGMKVEAVVPAGHMKEMAGLTPIPGKSWSYGYEVSFMEFNGQLPSSNSPGYSIVDQETVPAAPVPSASESNEALTDSPIVVYTKPGCGRCSMVKKEMNAKGISYTEIDISGTSPEVNHMWKQLREHGFAGNSVTMPVVRVNGQYHYDIKDLMGFVGKLKS